MDVAIVKYNAGNIYSVVNAMKRLGIEPVLTDDAEMLQKADRVLFPGQGQAREAMEYLKAHQLDQVIKNLKQPVLGICLGQQLMCAYSEEGAVDGLGIFPVSVKKFENIEGRYKIPQMGWNSLTELKSPLFKNIKENSFVYFVHSYYCTLSPYTIATCDYIHPFSAALQKDNFYAVQFHPEKSAAIGEMIIENFIVNC